MTPTDPTTSTPPAEAEGDDALNAEIARALGWAHVRIESETKRWIGQSPTKGYPTYVPDYAGDPAAALGLLAYVLQQRRKTTAARSAHADAPLVVTDITINEDGVYVEICAFNDIEHILAQFTGEASTLERAIARSCLAALGAVKGEGGESR